MTLLSLENETVEEEENDRANGCGDDRTNTWKECASYYLWQKANGISNEAPNQSADNTDAHRDEAATGVFAWHDEFC